MQTFDFLIAGTVAYSNCTEPNGAAHPLHIIIGLQSTHIAIAIASCIKIAIAYKTIN